MIDATDIAILKCLKENARINASEISDRISMSVSAVIERIRKLEASGVIQQYTLVLNAKKIHKDVSAFISVGMEHPKYNEGFEAAINNTPDVIECHYVTGDFDYMLKVQAESTEQLTKLLNEVKSIQGVSLTRTLVVLATTKNEYTVLPEGSEK